MVWKFSLVIKRMNKNNFKELEEILISKRPDDGQQTMTNLNTNIGMFGLASNLVDLFLPKVFNVISKSLENNNKKESQFPKVK